MSEHERDKKPKGDPSPEPLRLLKILHFLWIVNQTFSLAAQVFIGEPHRSKMVPFVPGQTLLQGSQGCSSIRKVSRVEQKKA